MNLYDNPMYQCFVHPTLCQKLLDAGVTPNTHYHYRLTGSIAELRTYAFDFDDYYYIADANVDYANQVDVQLLPAYQLKDIEKVIPPYLLTRNEKGYQLMCESLYDLPEQTADRMPDAFAKMLLEGLKKRLIKTTYTNHVISATH